MTDATRSDRRATLSATFHLTHDCNLRCSYCYTGAKTGDAMSDEVAERAIDFCLREARARDVDHLEVVFFGGEPLLRHQQLCRIVDGFRSREHRFHEHRSHEGKPRGRQRRLSFKLSTNGTLLDDEVLRGLSERGVFISLSMDGDAAVHDAQRRDAGGAGSSAAVHAAARRLLRSNPCAAVTCVVTPASAASLDTSVAALFETGFSYVTTTLDYSAAWSTSDLDDLRLAYERLADWYVARTLTGDKFYLGCFDDRIRSHAAGPPTRAERCSLGSHGFSIAPSGRLYPCVQFVGEDNDSSLRIGDVAQGLSSEATDALRCRVEAPKPECAGCAIAHRCSSWCACVNWQSTGSIERASPVLCEHERLLIPIADRVAARLWRQRSSNFLHKHYNPAFPVLSFAERLLAQEPAASRPDPGAAETNDV